jgi:hypothetical protein
MASCGSARKKGHQQDTPPSPARDKLFHLEPVCNQTHKASFQQPNCHAKKSLPRRTDFSEEKTKEWTGGFPWKSVTHNFPSRLQAAWSGLERKRHTE